MSKVYLINVGANSSDSSRARSPIFEDDRFIYVPFSFKRRGVDGYIEYPKPTRPFVRNMQGRSTIATPIGATSLMEISALTAALPLCGA